MTPNDADLQKLNDLANNSLPSDPKTISKTSTMDRKGKETSETCIALLCLSCSDSAWEIKWQNMFKELKTFKESEGHCNVPVRYDENLKLGTWVGTQRKAYKNRETRKSPYMSLHHYYLLNEIGFTWKAPLTGGRKHNNEKWLEMYKELEDFKNKFGHCRIPQNFPENPKLARWVHSQRVRYKDSQRIQYKYLMQNKITNMDLEMDRFRALEAVGFVWTQASSRFQPDEASWMKRFYELLDFKSKYGHFKVPRNVSEYKCLKNWVKRQRYHYKLLLAGKPSNLTEERKYALQQVKFL